MDYYNATDSEQWRQQIDDRDFKQSRCMPSNSEVVLFKCLTHFKAPVEALWNVIVLPEVRERWDKQIVDWKLHFMTPDFSYGRIGFNFKSPLKGVVDDRDFYLQQIVRKNFPSKGDFAIIQKSLPGHAESPHVRGRVRAHAHIISLLFRMDQSDQNRCEVFMVSCIDIKGNIPKFILNNATASVPRENLLNTEAAGVAWHNGTFAAKYGP
jgi:hypothetical protein